jgi:microcystin-dependent protein
LCNGASLSTTTYAGLFGVIGYNYGGAGASFTLPDFTSRVPLGITGTPTVPSTVTTAAASAVDAHTHGINSSFTAGSVNSSFTAGNATSHTHGVSGATGNESTLHYHFWSAAGVGTSGQSADHSHGYFKPNSGANNNTAGVNAGHTHTWTLTGQGNGSQLDVNGAANAYHVHNFSVTSGAPNATSINSSFTAGNVNSSFTAGTASTINASTPAHTHTTPTVQILFIIRVS